VNNSKPCRENMNGILNIISFSVFDRSHFIKLNPLERSKLPSNYERQNKLTEKLLEMGIKPECKDSSLQ